MLPYDINSVMIVYVNVVHIRFCLHNCLVANYYNIATLIQVAS